MTSAHPNYLLRLRYFLIPLCLGAWGCVLLRLYLSGQLAQIQNPTYHPFTFGFALILIFIAISFPLLFDPPETTSASPSLAALGGRALLLLLPFFAYLHLPDDFISTNFLRQRTSSALLSPGALKRFLPGKPGELYRLLKEQAETTPKDQPVSLDLLELIYLSQDKQLRELYDGHQVVIFGQWLSENPTQFKLARLLIFCCAADGRTVTLNVHGQTDLKDDGSWLEVIGTLRYDADTNIPKLELINYTKPEHLPDFNM
jgi:hypothetical protein